MEKFLLVLTSKKVGAYNEVLEKNSMLKDIQEEIKDASDDNEVVGLYDAEVEADLEMNTRIKEAVDDEKINTAKEFIKNGISLDIISNCTGLTMDKLEDIKNSID